MKNSGRSVLILLLLISLLIAATMMGCGQSPEADSAPDSQAAADSQVAAEKEVDSESIIEDNSGGIEASNDKGAFGDQTVDGVEAEGITSLQTPAQNADKKDQAFECTFSIRCSTVFDNLDRIDAGIVELLPQDGWIYPVAEVSFTEGESVFDILLRVTKQEGIHMESNSNPALKSKYVEGIHNLYEFDAGELSGWTYMINGKGMGYGSSSSYPKDGDIIEWVYTCDQGRDVGVTP